MSCKKRKSELILSKCEREVNETKVEVSGYIFINLYLCLDEGWLSLSDWPAVDQSKPLLVCNQAPAVHTGVEQVIRILSSTQRRGELH